MSGRNDRDAALLVALCVGLVVAAVILKFAETFGLNFTTAGWVVAYLSALTVATAIAVRAGFSVRHIWPLVLVLAWMCWWPALAYWAHDPLLPVDWAAMTGATPPWWSTWYARFGVIVVVLTVGYGIPAWRERY